jgi:hypothetical protein
MADPRKGREGSRWYNERPSGEEFAAWFKTVPIHDGLDHEDFVSGITLIQQVEKTLEVVGFDSNGAPQMQEIKHLVYIPYAKVDTRVAYFWKYMALNPEWLGLIEPVSYAGQLAHNYHLPTGFFGHIQSHGEKKTAYVGSSMQVKVFERKTVEFRDIIETGPNGESWKRRVAEGKLIFAAAPGTKIVATAGKYEVDHFSMMKAETGAVGRALGMAGMLVIPGSGVATAEDMQEAAAPAAAPGAAAASLPADISVGDAADQETDPAFLRDRIAALLTELGRDHPGALEGFQTWARERGFTSVDSLSDVQVKGVVKKLEKTLDDAKRQTREDAPALAAAE